MRNITVEEAERRFRALLAEVRDGARVSLTQDRVPMAQMVPPVARDDARALAYLALKRHIASRQPAEAPRLWTRADLYRDRKRP